LLSANHMTSQHGQNGAGSGAGWRRRIVRPLAGYRSIDWYLRLLVISTLAPAFAFSAYLLWTFISFERRSYEQRLEQSAVDLARDIDRDVEGLIVKVSTLATSPSLHRGDLAEFYAQATEVAVHDSNIVVLDLSLQQILNTLVPYGTALPKSGDPQTALRAIATKSPQVSDLFTGPVAGNLRLNVIVPVLRQDEVRFVLLLSFLPDRMLQLMQGQRLPHGWVTTLSDRQGKVIARSELNERFFGTTLSPDLLTARSEPGISPAKDLDGTPVLRVVARTTFGWLVAETVQQGLIDAAARAAIRNAVIGGAGLLLLSLLCAYAISRALRVPIGALAKQAEALGRGEKLPPIDTPIHEIGIVAAALSAAEADLRERARQRDEADRALRLNQAQFQAILDHAPVLVFVKDLAGNYTFVNRAAETWAGASVRPAVGQTARDIMSKEGADEVAQADAKVVATKAPLQREMALETPIGRRTMLSVKFPLLDAANSVSAVGTIVTDVTDQKHAEAQLSQAQRMEAVGQLTGGVAHDFNNMLTAILLNADVLATHVQDDGLRQLAEAMRRAAEHGADLTRRLLAFGRRQTLLPRPTDINELLADMVPLMERTLGEHIEIKLARGADLWPATVDRGQLESAVLNLAVNARDAMPNGGRLTIETANAELDESYASSNPDVRAGSYVMIAISDSGSGMSPDVLARVFEPFFTTKDVGQGTGLGLSMVYGFIKQSEGHVRIYSEVGVGTVVRLYLPRSRDVAVPAVAAPAALPTGTETILLVEDNSLVRTFASAQLAALGYRVVAAEDARRALEMVEHGCAPDLLFTDVIMPGGMNGRELAEQLRRRRPGLKVLYTSGYAHGAMTGEAAGAAPVTHLLGKPYRRRDLATKVREALDETAAA
jgi:PAS domain S-box-containing protein